MLFIIISYGKCVFFFILTFLSLPSLEKEIYFRIYFIAQKKKNKKKKNPFLESFLIFSKQEKIILSSSF